MFYNNKKGYVYLLQVIDSNNNPTQYVKIGSTERSTQERLSELQTGNSRKLKLHRLLEVPRENVRKKENDFLNMFSCYHDDTMQGGKELFNNSPIKGTRPITTGFEIDSSHYVPKNSEDFSSFEKYLEKLDEFKNGKYQDTFKWIKDNAYQKLCDRNNIIIIAPPKSGKRIMVQSIALLFPHNLHLYITAQDRKDMHVQYNELNNFNIPISTISVTNKSKEYSVNTNKILSEFEKRDNDVIFIHIDECDYGSAEAGKLDEFREKFKKNNAFKNTKIIEILYSATPEEAIFANNDYELCIFKPDYNNYHGPEFFINNNLSHEAEMFITKNEKNNLELSEQAKKIIKNLQDSKIKKVSVVRLSYNIGRESAYKFAKGRHRLQAEIDKLFNTYNNKDHIKCKFVDCNKDTKDFDWSFYNDKENELGDWAKFTEKKLIIIRSICTRGTEVGFHPLIDSWHDYRAKGTNYGTYAQALGRVFHYEPDYNERKNTFNHADLNINIYGDADLFETMSKIYLMNSKQEIKEHWENWKNDRDVSSRVSESNENSNKVEIKRFAVIDNSCIENVDEFVRKWQIKISGKASIGKKYASKNISTNSPNVCENLLKRRAIKGSVTVICKVEKSFKDIVQKKIDEKNKTHINKLINSYNDLLCSNDDIDVIYINSLQSLYDYLSADKEVPYHKELIETADDYKLTQNNTHSKIATIKIKDVIDKYILPVLSIKVKNNNIKLTSEGSTWNDSKNESK